MEDEKEGGWDRGKADKQKGMGWRGMNEEVVDGYNSSDFIVRDEVSKCGATRIEMGIFYCAETDNRFRLFCVPLASYIHNRSQYVCV